MRYLAPRTAASSVAGLLLLASLLSCATTGDKEVPGCIGKCDDVAGGLQDLEFEYIVVGSGAGGGPLAANLARQGHTVLLLEAGEDTGGKTAYQVPVMHASATEEPGLAWWYFVDHYSDPARAAQDSKITDEGILYPRGGALGGSTAVNAMITVAPKNSDWDHIAQVTGDDSWRHQNMHRYHDRVMSWLEVGSADVTIGLFDFKLLAIVTAAVIESVNAGHSGPNLNPLDLFRNINQLINLLFRDINHAIMNRDAEGVYGFPLAVTRDNRRNGAREYILATATDPRGFPLTVKTRALVTRVLFDSEPLADGSFRATGVAFLDGANLYAADLLAHLGAAAPPQVTVRATREVILSAGAFNTPQLLKLSGIGAREELERHGIPTVVDLPGVGENLQDRYEVGVVSEMSSDFSSIRNCTYGFDENDPCLRDWEQGRGPYTTNGGVASILMKSDPSRPDADLHIFGVPGAFKGYYPGYSTDALQSKRLFSWVILKGHTENRAGTVKLRSADPRERPAIQFHYFDDGDVDAGQDVNDLTAVVNAVEFVRNIQKKTDSLLPFQPVREVWPGPEADSREKIAQWVKDEAWGHHASCSAPIGAADDPMAVLDSRFRVRGTSGLRVVDASVFPKIPGTFIVLPIYMVSEKATDVILEDRGEVRIEANFPR
jgi:choline dehydrogenase